MIGNVREGKRFRNEREMQEKRKKGRQEKIKAKYRDRKKAGRMVERVLMG